MKPLPEWIKIYTPEGREEYQQIKKLFSFIEKENLHTICQEALCPNRFECFSHGVATFLLLGDICTRDCKFCYVEKKGKKEPEQPNLKEEPKKVAHAVKELKLNYAVITCVTRDDLKDGGAGVFSKTVEEIRKISPYCKIELLISDLQGNFKALKMVVDSKPDVLGHNLDTVKRIFPKIKPLSSYERSLKLLKKVKEFNAEIKTKSGLMLGLGEETEEVIQTMEDLRNSAGVNFLTLGQYLQPSKEHAKVKKFYSPQEFKELEIIGYSLGFEDVASAPLVRSSYRADKLIEKID
jgi:lipoic acid synthetase